MLELSKEETAAYHRFRVIHRNPKLIERAFHRKKNAEMAAKNIYAEVVARPPFVPVSLVLVNFNRNSVIP